MDSLWTTLATSRKNGMVLGFYGTGSADIYVARNQTILGPMRAEGFDYDWLMWIDSDQKWEAEDILRLVEDDKDIVSGLTPISMSGDTQCGWINEDGEQVFLNDKDEFDTPIQEVDFAGFGFLLVRKGVFEKLAYPYFQFGTRMTKSGLKFLGEDVAFSQKVKDKGFKIWCDTRVRVGHEKMVGMELSECRESIQKEQ